MYEISQGSVLTLYMVTTLSTSRCGLGSPEAWMDPSATLPGPHTEPSTLGDSYITIIWRKTMGLPTEFQVSLENRLAHAQNHSSRRSEGQKQRHDALTWVRKLSALKRPLCSD